MKVIRISAILICVILMSACENNMFSSGKSANEALESIKNKLKLIDDKITKLEQGQQNMQKALAGLDRPAKKNPPKTGKASRLATRPFKGGSKFSKIVATGKHVCQGK